MRRVWISLGVVILLEALFTGVGLAHDCSSEGDCLQTAGYNAAMGVGGGMIAILSGILAAQVASAVGGFLPGMAGSAAIPNLPPVPLGPGGVIVDENGEPLIAWSSDYGAGENGYGGKPGDVWYNGNWVDPDYAREQVAEDIYYARQRDREREAFWAETQELSAQWMRDRVAANEAEAARERAEIQSRQDALETLERIEDYADRRGYDDIFQRAQEDAFNPNGSINVDYVNRLRDALSNRIGRDLAAPDEELRRGWVGEFLSNTWDDARHNPFIRVGVGVLSGGTSEIYYQSQGAYEAMQRSFDEASRYGQEWNVWDAMYAGYGEFAEQNLPLNTYRTLQDPNSSWLDVAGNMALDAFQVFDNVETLRNLGGSWNAFRGGGGAWDVLTHRAPPLDLFGGGDDVHRWPGQTPDFPPGSRNISDLPPGSTVRPGEFGIPEYNGRGIQMVADKYGLNIEVRPTSQNCFDMIRDGYPPKPPDLHSKTINQWDTYFGASADDVGKVGYFPPTLPEGVNVSDLPGPAQSRYYQRLTEYADFEVHMRDLEADGLIRVDNGVVYNTGLNPDPNTLNMPFTGDHDIFRITSRGGGDIPQAVKDQAVAELRQFGVEHPAHMDWTPTSAPDVAIDEAIIGRHLHTAEGGAGETLIAFGSDRAPMTSYARPEDVRSGWSDPYSLEYQRPDGSWTR